MKRVMVIGVLVTMFAGTGLFAKEAVDPKAQEILEKAALAEKSRDTAGMATYYEESESAMYDNDGAVAFIRAQTRYVKGKKTRITTATYDPAKRELQDETCYVFDGTNGWMLTCSGKKKIEADRFMKMAKEYANDFSVPLSTGGGEDTPKGNTHYTDYGGTENVGGIPCHVIRMGELQGNEKSVDAQMWISTDGFDVVKTGITDTEIVNADFRTVQGRRFPFSSELHMNGKKQIVTRVKAIRINGPVDDAIFNVDAIVVRKGTGRTGMAAGMLLPALAGEEADGGVAGENAAEKTKAEPAGTQVKEEIKKETGRQIIKSLWGTLMP